MDDRSSIGARSHQLAQFAERIQIDPRWAKIGVESLTQLAKAGVTGNRREGTSSIAKKPVPPRTIFIEEPAAGTSVVSEWGTTVEQAGEEHQRQVAEVEILGAENQPKQVRLHATASVTRLGPQSEIDLPLDQRSRHDDGEPTIGPRLHERNVCPVIVQAPRVGLELAHKALPGRVVVGRAVDEPGREPNDHGSDDEQGGDKPIEV